MGYLNDLLTDPDTFVHTVIVVGGVWGAGWVLLTENGNEWCRRTFRTRRRREADALRYQMLHGRTEDGDRRAPRPEAIRHDAFHDAHEARMVARARRLARDVGLDPDDEEDVASIREAEGF